MEVSWYESLDVFLCLFVSPLPHSYLFYYLRFGETKKTELKYCLLYSLFKLSGAQLVLYYLV